MQKIILIAGHAYPTGDTGATIPQTTEARQNVEVVDEVSSLLESKKYNRDDIRFEIYKCPHELSGQAEINWVNDRSDNDAIILSIHHNAEPTGKASGVEAYYHAGNKKGEDLAIKICRKISEKTGTPNRGAKIESQSQHNSIGIISKTKGTAVLIECGFLTNPKDQQTILDPNKDNLYSEAIAEALEEFLGIPKPETIPTQETPNSPILEEMKNLVDEFCERANNLYNKYKK